MASVLAWCGLFVKSCKLRSVSGMAGRGRGLAMKKKTTTKIAAAPKRKCSKDKAPARPRPRQTKKKKQCENDGADPNPFDMPPPAGQQRVESFWGGSAAVATPPPPEDGGSGGSGSPCASAGRKDSTAKGDVAAEKTARAAKAKAKSRAKAKVKAKADPAAAAVRPRARAKATAKGKAKAAKAQAKSKRKAETSTDKGKSKSSSDSSLSHSSSSSSSSEQLSSPAAEATAGIKEDNVDCADSPPPAAQLRFHMDEDDGAFSPKQRPTSLAQMEEDSAGSGCSNNGDGNVAVDPRVVKVTATDTLEADEARCAASMFRFPVRHVRRVLEHFGQQSLQQLCDNLDGCKLLSLYSGLGGAELSLQSCWNAVQTVLNENPQLSVDRPQHQPTMAAACDIESACQKVLRNHSDPPQVIVPDLCAFVNQSLLPRLHVLIDEARAENQSRIEALQRAERAEQAARKKLQGKRKDKKTKKKEMKLRRRQGQKVSESESLIASDNHGDDGDDGDIHNDDGPSIGEKLLEDLLKEMPPESFPEKVQALDGQTLNLKELRASKLLIVAGSVCKDWSSMNQGRQKLCGNYVLPFAIMLALVRCLDPLAFLHECTRDFQPDKLAKHLPNHNLMSSTLEPECFGFPVKRSRSYSALVSKGYKIVRDADHMRRLFTPTRVDCGVFCMADNLEAGLIGRGIEVAEQ